MEIHQDGVAESKKDARDMLDLATVIHGQTVEVDGDLHFYTGPAYGLGEESYETSSEATWVEIEGEDE